MPKGLRLSEKWFQWGLWSIAVLFAACLVGLGSLVVNDLPKVERPPSPEQFMDRTRLGAERAQLAADNTQLQGVNDADERANDSLRHAQEAYASERESFNNWIATRSATQQQRENPEVLQRTRALDVLKATERQQQQQVDALETKNTALDQDKSAHERAIEQIEEAGQTDYGRALQRMQLRVFGLRLLLTLPLLALAVWLFLKRRKGPRWPFVWGFIFFALFTFFFELVPYMPSYGGYLRYLVGLGLTVWAGNYAIAALRRYLEAQKLAETRPEQERRRDLGFELAQTRLARRICPACERPLDTGDQSNNFCMNCGLLVFESCPRCTARQTTFSHFCRSCGLEKHTAAPPQGPPTPPLAVSG